VSSTTWQESWGENELKKWTWNVILMKTLKMTSDFHSFSCYYVPLRAESQMFASKDFVNTYLIYVDLLYKRLSYMIFLCLWTFDSKGKYFPIPRYRKLWRMNFICIFHQNFNSWLVGAATRINFLFHNFSFYILK
jgi:hypothetical protein